VNLDDLKTVVTSPMSRPGWGSLRSGFRQKKAAGAEGVSAMNRAVRRARGTRHIAVPLTRRRSTGYPTSTMHICMILSRKVLTGCVVNRAMIGERKIPYRAFGESDPVPRTRGIILVCILLVAANGLAWTWALAEFTDQRTLLGAAILAYTFGLRYAIDGDHIAAIDHATRKVPQTAERAIAASLFFTMGHSMVVVAGMVAVAAAAIALGRYFQQFETVSGWLATGTSTIVLLGIAIVNSAIFAHVLTRFSQMYRSGTVNHPETPETLAGPRFRPMYHHLQIFYVNPLQFIFRLGLGGVAEVIILGTLSAQAAVRGSMLSWLVLPTLFTVALVLIDTTDGTPISYACTRALGTPLRRIWFCLAVTVVSALVAFFICGGRSIGISTEIAQHHGKLWPTIGESNHCLGAIDCVAICFFVLSLVVSAQVCRREYRCESG
jgi:nickel/cobalt transporter (NiCoT) family protein